MRRYRINGQDWQADAPEFLGLVAQAYGKTRDRILCLCQPAGVEMYVQKRHGHYLVKRMPNSAQRHHPDCDAFQLPSELSGASQLDGQAVKEDVNTGITTLRLDFALSKRGGKAPASSGGDLPDVATSSGAKLTLRSLLQLLWQDAGFNKWSPAMKGKRSWGVLRKYLLEAAEDKQTRQANLKQALYIPEPYDREHYAESSARRHQALAAARKSTGSAQPLMLVVGEIKEIAPSRTGFKIILKHLPDFHWFMDEELYKRIQRYFEAEFELWDGLEHSHLMMIGTFMVSSNGFALLQEVSVMNVTAEWLPIEHAAEYLLVQALVEQDRRFVKGLRFNLAKNRPIASALLTDTQPKSTALYIKLSDDPAYEAHWERSCNLRTSNI